jgi:hypothetical protein
VNVDPAASSMPAIDVHGRPAPLPSAVDLRIAQRPGRAGRGPDRPRPSSSRAAPAGAGTARGRGQARALARPALGRPPSLSRPAGGDLGGRPRDRPALGAVASCRAMNRRDADLCAGRRLSRAAPARCATDLPAVRVLGAGGGGRRPFCDGRRRCRGGLLDEALRRCLTQRGEHQRRVHGVAHQRCERALLRAAGCGLRGEHVFVKLRPGSDGSRKIRDRSAGGSARFGSARGLRNTRSATDLARLRDRPEMEPIPPRTGSIPGLRSARRARPAARRAAGRRCRP